MIRVVDGRVFFGYVGPSISLNYGYGIRNPNHNFCNKDGFVLYSVPMFRP